MLLLKVIRCDPVTFRVRLVGVTGWMVALGFPKTDRSLRLKIKIFSVQVPETEMLAGVLGGNVARAAVIVVNAPGVAPEQSTTAWADAKLHDKRTSKQANRSLDPEV
jgi:hypothetical protein